ncbi:hypothetical protein Angca_009430, partial [Angiostrongylus cantonensis]
SRINPNHIHALTNVFVLLDELEQCNLVVEISRKLPDTFINQEAALAFQIGVCLGKMKRFREAEDRLKVAVRINPHNSMYYANLGKF